MSEDTYSLFFYGTLLHPDILKRVINQDGINLRIQPAILHDYTRHHVKQCDYPAILPYSESQKIISQDLSKEDKCVRGSLVSGFTKLDVDLLDVFEGDEYDRVQVNVYPLTSAQPLSNANPEDVCEPLPLPKDDNTKALPAHTYVWAKGLDSLEPELWSFETFLKDKLNRWIGSAGAQQYFEVDQRIAMAGVITPATNHSISQQAETGETKEEYTFGRDMLKHFGFDKSYINLNHGSYGSTPLVVTEALIEIERDIEANPDLFHRITGLGKMNSIRERLARFIGAHTDEVVIVPNASTGVNTVVHNFDWNEDDILIGFTTTYGAVARTLHSYVERRPHPNLSIINLTFPTTPEAIVNKYRTHLSELHRGPNSKVVVVIDAIISNPGTLLPWEDLVAISRESNVISVVDAAHAIGQIPLNLHKSDPDFFITNCHKWLYTKRATAVLYVPRRNHQLIRYTFPISIGYASPPNPVRFVEQFDWVGTIDYGPYLTVHAALDFRERIGGEEKIQKYCHQLARDGGKRMIEILGTELLDPDDKFTASMVDVLLPYHESPISPQKAPFIVRHIHSQLIQEWHCMSAVYVHNGKLWTRCSAQVWNEISDFEYLSNALISILKAIKENPQVIVVQSKGV